MAIQPFERGAVPGVQWNCMKPARSTASLASSMLPLGSAACHQQVGRLQPRIAMLVTFGQRKDE
jgi:hypothetical protein